MQFKHVVWYKNYNNTSFINLKEQQWTTIHKKEFLLV